ncbi:MAG: TetR/AcrR family transcriptional regulator [Bacteroidota bacterium]
MLDKQKQILAAALKLFVAYGFHGTPTSKIAEEAGVANGTLFHYYKTKDDLVLGLYNHIKDDMASAMSAIIHESDFITPKFRNTFIHTLYWALNNRDKFYYIHQFESSPHMAKISRKAMQDQAMMHGKIIDEAVKKKLLQAHPRDLIITLFNSQVFGIYQYLTSAKFSPEEEGHIINEGYEMVWEMLKYK